MTLNDIKKALYKQDPDAVFLSASKDGMLYYAMLREDDESATWGKTDSVKITTIQFRIPFNELGDVKWEQKMEAKLLIRYIVQ